MRKFKLIIFILMFLGGGYSIATGETIPNHDKIMELVEKVALEFDYYDEISTSAKNVYKGPLEKGGQCADYALAFVNLWNNELGIGHPQLGGYKIRLLKEAHVKNHFEIKNWNSNGPHVWVKIGDSGVDPTYADIGISPVIGNDIFQ